ncbi:helix-turn-helix domain-containing protein [Stratiformator vulcanicus]|uniref:Virulence regulon transcriptional activator VirF n=1 Tax=Stratiformator vulcanicus TaxID=2527980 RepID=A0A517QYZ3_9PLAN|nr:helix-turn-helix domain-containing protein [Stratiformator vulcanicus]QDT36869.1 Virulence regulon transcriptional activator VirF [Stratiformator vulcanicus]
MHSPFFFQKSFRDFDELAIESQAWNLDLRQFDRGSFRGEIFQVGTTRSLLSRARFGRQLVQAGSAPYGMRTFAFPSANTRDFEWRGRTVTNSDLLVFPVNGELQAVSDATFEVDTLSVSDEILDSVEMPEFGRSGESAVLRCDRTRLNAFRQRLKEIQRDIETQSDVVLLPSFQAEFDVMLAQGIASIASVGRVQLRGERSAGHRAVGRAVEFMAEHAHLAVTIPEVATAAGVSERALRYGFQERFGLSPKQYLQACRLNGVRKALVAGDSRVSIQDVAIRWGFWHMGQFAADYRRHFGELPSDTQARFAA